MKLVANNKVAFHNYNILDKFEAGIVLVGGEVKAVRAGRVNLRDSYVRIDRGEIFLLQAHISQLETTNRAFGYDEIRKRKLLLHKREIEKLFGKVSKTALTIVPTKLYINSKNLIKVEIGLAEGKKLHDKRQALKEKDLKRESDRAMKNFQ
ncbi:SsrA-binding protein [Thiovulum sp. ES]|nr:SsrA-binding protein [Thiovulum sp. ES]